MQDIIELRYFQGYGREKALSKSEYLIFMCI